MKTCHLCSSAECGWGVKCRVQSRPRATWYKKNVTRNIRQNCLIFHAACSSQNSPVLLHASLKSDLLISQKRIQNHKRISSAINCLSRLLWRIPNQLAVPAQALSFVIAFPSLDKGWWEWNHTSDYFWALLTASRCPLEWAAQDSSPLGVNTKSFSREWADRFS